MKFLSHFTIEIVKRQRLATKVTAIDLTDPRTVSCCKGVVERKRETSNDSSRMVRYVITEK